MYAKRLVFLFLLVVIAQPVISLQISEIMQNPSGTDTGREWIELYNNDSMEYNLTGWKINTDNSDHSLNVPPSNGGQGSALIAPGSFAVIAQDASSFVSDYNGYNGTVIDSSWTDLSNSQNRTIWIKNSSIVFDNVTYSPVSEGDSTCLVNNSFSSCVPTPGVAGVLNQSVNNSVYPSADASIDFLIGNALVNSTHTIFSVNLTGKDCSRLDNLTLSYNIMSGSSGSLSAEVGCNASFVSWAAVPGNYTICGSLANLTFSDTNLSNNSACKSVSVSEVQRRCNTTLFISSEQVINSGTALEYKLLLNDSYCNETSVEVEYWIEDLFGAYAKNKLNTTQEFSCSKQVDRQWTPDGITGSEGYKIKAVLRTSCPDNNSDNSAEKLIVVKGSQASSSSSSTPGSGISSGGSLNSNISTAKKKGVEIISYPIRVYVGEQFETVMNVSSSGTIYSYVYSGNNPVSEWGSKAWDANKKEGIAGIVSLPLRIENSTAPGNYTMKIRLKADKDEDVTASIEVLERPKLMVEKTKSSINLTACEGCELLIIARDFEFSGNNYTLESPGTYHVLMLKDSKIFSRELFVLENKSIDPKPVGKITGLTAKRSRRLDKTSLLMLRGLSKVKLF